MLKVSVPATSANLGPGFDSVGIALNLYNDFYFYAEHEKNIVMPEFELLDENSLCHRAFKLYSTKLGLDLSIPKIAIKASVPQSRGLGSSATLTVAGLMGAKLLSKTHTNDEEVLSMASEIEGHPDNAAPALFGGLVISTITPDGIKYIRVVPKNDLISVAAVPEFELKTADARRVLPESILHADAVHNTGNFGLFMTSMLTGEYSYLKYAMVDYLHQPYRMPLVPGLKEVVDKAVDNGALGCCLSGAGPTILSFCYCKDAKRVSTIMKEVWQEFGIMCSTHVLEIQDKGVTWENRT